VLDDPGRGVVRGRHRVVGALFPPFVLALGRLGREQGVPRTGWLLTGGCTAGGVLLVVSVRCARPVVGPAEGAPPGEVVCRELVELVTDLLDGALPPGCREGGEAHLADCDGCTEYLRQIRATIEALGALPLTRKLPALRTGRAGIAPSGSWRAGTRRYAGCECGAVPTADSG